MGARGRACRLVFERSRFLALDAELSDKPPPGFEYSRRRYRHRLSRRLRMKAAPLEVAQHYDQCSVHRDNKFVPSVYLKGWADLMERCNLFFRQIQNTYCLLISVRQERDSGERMTQAETELIRRFKAEHAWRLILTSDPTTKCKGSGRANGRSRYFRG